MAGSNRFRKSETCPNCKERIVHKCGRPEQDEAVRAGEWFFHAHGAECDPVCVLERLAKGTWVPARPKQDEAVQRREYIEAAYLRIVEANRASGGGLTATAIIAELGTMWDVALATERRLTVSRMERLRGEQDSIGRFRVEPNGSVVRWTDLLDDPATADVDEEAEK